MTEMLSGDRLRGLVSEGEKQAVREALADAHPYDIADLVENLDDDELQWSALWALPPELRAETFSHLPLERQAALASKGELNQVARLLERMAPDDRTDVVEDLDEDRRQQLYAAMRQSDRAVTERLSQYAENSVGTVMSTDFAALPADQTIDEAIQLLRLQAPRKETIYYAYIMDENGRLIGLISLKDLILAQPNQRVRDIMQTDVISVRVDEDRVEAAAKIQAYDLLALPVVDDGDRLVGIVTVDDVVDVQQEEVTEDFHKLGGVATLDQPYLTTSITTLVRKRVGWLAILFGAGLLTVGAMGAFEEHIEQLPLLAVFVPLIIATGGNSGFQAATVMTRAIALREVAPEHFGRVFTREMLGGLMLGLMLAAIAFVMATAVGLWMYAGEEAVAARSANVGVAVSMAVISVVLFGNMVGSMLPFILLRLGLDPATGSTPFVATIVDVIGLLLYFSIATWWLGDQMVAAEEVAMLCPLVLPWV